MLYVIYLFFIAAGFFHAPAHGLDMSALESMLGNDAMFDGSGGGFDDWGGGDVFGGGGFDFGALDVDFDGSRPKKEEKKLPVLEKVDSPKAAFLQDMPEATAKLPQQHKKAATFFITNLVTTLQALRTHLTNSALSIARQEELKPTADNLPAAVEKLELLRSNNAYLLTLYSKEFHSLREKLISAGQEATKIEDVFSKLPIETEENFLQPISPKTLRDEKEATKKVERFVSGTVQKLIADITKVVEHKTSKKGLEDKTKKRKTLHASSRSGGHSSFADGDGYDGFDAFGGGYGGDWGGGTSRFSDGFGFDDAQFGGWGDGGNSFFDSYGSSGFDAHGGWGASDWEQNNGSSTTNGTQGQAAQMLYAAPSTPQSADPDDDLPLGQTQRVQPSGNYLENQADLSPEERIMQDAQRVTALLKKWQDLFEKMIDEAGKQQCIRHMLSDAIFASSLHPLNDLIDLVSENDLPEDEKTLAAVNEFITQLHRAAPLLLLATKYTSPLLSNETDAMAMAQKIDGASVELTLAQEKGENESIVVARARVVQQAKIRNACYRFLLKVHATIAQHGDAKTQQRVYTTLRTYENSAITQLKALRDKLATGYLSLAESAVVLQLSQGILRQPISISFASAVPAAVTQAGDEMLLAAAATVDDQPAEVVTIDELTKQIHALQDDLIAAFEKQSSWMQETIKIMGTILDGKAALPTVIAELEKLSSETGALIDRSSQPEEVKKHMIPLLLPVSSELWSRTEALLRAQLATYQLWTKNKEAEQAALAEEESDDSTSIDGTEQIEQEAHAPQPSRVKPPVASQATPPEATEPDTQAPLSPDRLERARQAIARFQGGKMGPAAQPTSPTPIQPAEDEGVESQDEEASPSADMPGMQEIMNNPKIMQVMKAMEKGTIDQATAMQQIESLISAN